MSIIVNVVNYGFDMFIILIYFNNILKKRKQSIPAPFFYGCFIMMEIIMLGNSILHIAKHTYTSLIFTVILSFTTTYALCFLYDVTIKHKLFTSISFQLFALLGEEIFSVFVTKYKPDILSFEPVLLTAIMNLGSKLILLLLVLSCIFFWNRKIQHSTPSYTVLLFVTPVISLFITLSMPASRLVDSDLNVFFLLLFFSIILLNVSNYFMLDYVIQLTRLRTKTLHMQQQITFQTEKYQQLSSAYRKTRRIVHDIKKHYFSIQTHIEKQEYDKLDDYLKTAISDLESSYAKINTGNLVIDSLVSNYSDLASEEGISFTTDIHIDSDCIPVKDYDLCVILGNLLDNSLQACRKLPVPEQRFINVHIYMDTNNTFIIHLSNPAVPKDVHKGDGREIDFSYTLVHGYGLENVRTIATAYHGMCQTIADQTYDVYVVIPIIEDGKRRHKPHC